MGGLFELGRDFTEGFSSKGRILKHLNSVVHIFLELVEVLFW
jgi:hypothetical protein